jgi:hypothetical protein
MSNTSSATDARASYEARSTRLLQNLDRIRAALKRHAQEFDGRNWGFVGDLGYVIEQTAEAVDFLERSAPVRPGEE